MKGGNNNNNNNNSYRFVARLRSLDVKLSPLSYKASELAFTQLYDPFRTIFRPPATNFLIVGKWDAEQSMQTIECTGGKRIASV